MPTALFMRRNIEFPKVKCHEIFVQYTTLFLRFDVDLPFILLGIDRHLAIERPQDYVDNAKGTAFTI